MLLLVLLGVVNSALIRVDGPPGTSLYAVPASIAPIALSGGVMVRGPTTALFGAGNRVLTVDTEGTWKVVENVELGGFVDPKNFYDLLGAPPPMASGADVSVWGTRRGGFGGAVSIVDGTPTYLSMNDNGNYYRINAVVGAASSSSDHIYIITESSAFESHLRVVEATVLPFAFTGRTADIPIVRYNDKTYHNNAPLVEDGVLHVAGFLLNASGTGPAHGVVSLDLTTMEYTEIALETKTDENPRSVTNIFSDGDHLYVTVVQCEVDWNNNNNYCISQVGTTVDVWSISGVGNDPPKLSPIQCAETYPWASRTFPVVDRSSRTAYFLCAISNIVPAKLPRRSGDKIETTGHACDIVTRNSDSSASPFIEESGSFLVVMGSDSEVQHIGEVRVGGLSLEPRCPAVVAPVTPGGVSPKGWIGIGVAVVVVGVGCTVAVGLACVWRKKPDGYHEFADGPPKAGHTALSPQFTERSDPPQYGAWSGKK